MFLHIKVQFLALFNVFTYSLYEKSYNSAAYYTLWMIYHTFSTPTRNRTSSIHSFGDRLHTIMLRCIWGLWEFWNLDLYVNSVLLCLWANNPCIKYHSLVAYLSQKRLYKALMHDLSFICMYLPTVSAVYCIFVSIY